MDLLSIGKQLLGTTMSQQLGDKAGGIMQAVTKLTEGEGLNLAGLSSMLEQNGLGEQVKSWLGDGENQEISAEQLKDAIGEEKVAEVASDMGVEAGDALESLRSALPNILNNASEGGSILDQFGDIQGLLGKAKNLLS